MNNINCSSNKDVSLNRYKKSIKAISVMKGDLVKKNLCLELGRLDKIRGHKFMTKKILNKAERIWRNSEQDDAKVLVKFFSPSMTWYISEIDIKDEWIAFGYVIDESTKEWELWNISLKELSLVRTPFWLPIERDLYFSEDYSLDAIMNNKRVLSEWDKVYYKNENKDRILTVVETWLWCTWHNDWPAVTIKPDNEEWEELYDDLEEDLVIIK